jgi:hypothetical protein
MAGSKKSDGPAPTIEVGDIVLAKVKGYPPWPARVSARRFSMNLIVTDKSIPCGPIWG